MLAGRVVSSIVCVDSTENEFTLTVSDEGNVFVLGSSTYHGFNASVPQQIPNLKNISSIACGSRHSVCLDMAGNVFSFGSNIYGQLGIGLGLTDMTSEPQKVSIPPIIQIACGNNFTLCVSEDLRLFSFGHNESGQLGIAKSFRYKPFYVSTPKMIESLENVDFVACGGDFCVCKLLNNDCYVWGQNRSSQLGFENTGDITSPHLCIDWPEDIVDIKCGLEHTLVLTSDQQVYTSGYGIFGQLGKFPSRRLHNLSQNYDLLEIIRIECGYNHSICIDVYDTVYVFGLNSNGQLGLGDFSDKYTCHALEIPSDSSIISISSGGDHTFVKTSANEIFGFGNNRSSQILENEKSLISSPVRVFEGMENIWKSKKSKAKSARK